jgi:hypothetical protein
MGLRVTHINQLNVLKITHSGIAVTHFRLVNKLGLCDGSFAKRPRKSALTTILDTPQTAPLSCLFPHWPELLPDVCSSLFPIS